LRKIRKNVKFEGIFHELYKFVIVIIFHVDVKVISSQPPLAKNSNIFQTWRIPSQVRKYQRFPIVAGSIWRYVHSHHQHSFPFTRHSAAQTSPREYEAGNLNGVFAMLCLSSFMRR
jgi:hypothetical protein